MENFLTSLAFLDSKHDFGADYAKSYKHIIQTSLPGKIMNIKDEEEALDIASKYCETIDHVGTNPNQIFTNMGGSDTTPIGIVCDSSFCVDIVNELKKNTIGNVYYIINREIIMDPGNNKGMDDDSHNFFVAKDVDTKTIKYSKYIRSNNYAYAHTDLHSLFDISIENTLIHSNQQFILKTFLNNILLEKIKTKKQNTITNVKRKIATNRNNHDIINSCFLRKRAGDWLQILSCLDKDRKYLINGNVKNLTDCILYFCSADRVAIAFALCCGINCILFRNNDFYMYSANEIEVPSHRMSTFELFNYYKTVKLSETVELLNTGLQEFNRLRNEWKEKLNTITSVKSCNEIKELIYLAFHYDELFGHFGSYAIMEIVNEFVKNPNSNIFDSDHSYCSIIIDSIKKFPLAIRRHMHMNPFEISPREKYYNKFKFENISLESFDLMYGCDLMENLIFNDEMKEFTSNAIHRLIEITGFNKHVMTLYSIFCEKNKLTNTIQYGGGYKPSSSDIQEIANYITKYLLSPKKVTDLYVGEFSVVSLCLDVLGEELMEFILYEKGITSPDYIKYVEYVNSEPDSDDGIGRLHDTELFLKRAEHWRKSNMKKTNKLKHRNLFMLQKTIKTRRHKRQRSN
jgi:hypothetical protein